MGTHCGRVRKPSPGTSKTGQVCVRGTSHSTLASEQLPWRRGPPYAGALRRRSAEAAARQRDCPHSSLHQPADGNSLAALTGGSSLGAEGPPMRGRYADAWSDAAARQRSTPRPCRDHPASPPGRWLLPPAEWEPENDEGPSWLLLKGAKSGSRIAADPSSPPRRSDPPPRCYVGPERDESPAEGRKRRETDR
jgi:hypothetical protein